MLFYLLPVELTEKILIQIQIQILMKEMESSVGLFVYGAVKKRRELYGGTRDYPWHQ